MHISYKYLDVGKGLLVIFEEKTPNQSKIPMTIVKLGEMHYLSLYENFLIPLTPEILDILSRTKHLHIAYSNIFDTKVQMQGTVELDDVLIGKILAYIEMGQTV
jgi:hypothetical protein